MSSKDNYSINYDRQIVKQWGRTVCRLRITGPFHKLLSAEIEFSEYTNKELAYQIGASLVTLNKWKAGRNYPAGHYIWRIALALHKEDAEQALIRYIKMIDTERK